MTAVLDPLLRAVAAHGLAGSLLELPAEPLPPMRWVALFDGVRRHGLVGHLVAAMSTGAWPATSGQQQQASTLHLQGMEVALRLEATLLDVLGDLDAGGYDVRVLKGTSVAHLDYPDPALRLFGDLDLLVRSEQFDDVAAMFTRLGYRRGHTEPRPGFDRRYNKGVTFTRQDGDEVDVHRTFVLGPFGLRLDLDALWSPPTGFMLADRLVPALPLEQRALNACFNSGIGQTWPRLAAQRDLAQTLLAQQLDTDLFMALVTASRAEPVVARAVRQTWDALELADMTRVSEWARHYQPAPRALRDLALHDSDHVSFTAQGLASVGALPSVVDKARFLTTLAFPAPEFAADHPPLTQRLRRGLHDLRAARSLP